MVDIKEVLKYSRFLKIEAEKLTKSIEDAEDLVQDTLLMAFKLKHLYDPERSSVGTWVTTLMRNKFINDWHAKERYKRKGKLIHVETLTPEKLPSVESDLLTKLVLEQIENLPELQKSVIKLKMEGYNTYEISDILKIPVGSVPNYTNRKKLGKSLYQYIKN